MRFALLVTLSLLYVGPCQAQAQVPAQTASAPPKASTTSVADAVEKRAERIQIEDAGARIDELRLGGETVSIRVQPKNRWPAYQIAPGSGERSWKILSF